MSELALAGKPARVRRRNTIVLVALLAIVTASLAVGMWHAMREAAASAAPQSVAD